MTSRQKRLPKQSDVCELEVEAFFKKISKDVVAFCFFVYDVACRVNDPRLGGVIFFQSYRGANMTDSAAVNQGNLMHNVSGGNQKVAIFAVSNKGGVGKTMLAKCFTDYLRDRKLSAAVFDTDGDVRGLLKLYGDVNQGKDEFSNDPLKSVGYFDMQITDDRENIVNATETKADILFFDTPAGSIRKIFTSQKSSERFVKTLNGEGYKLVLLLLVDPYDDTIDGIQMAIDIFGDSAQYVVWKNMAHATPQDFIYFEPPSVLPDAEPVFLDADGKPLSARQLVEDYRGLVYEIPDLPLRTNARIRRLGLRFRQASQSGSPLKANDKSLVRDWQEEMDKNFDDMLSKIMKA